MASAGQSFWEVEMVARIFSSTALMLVVTAPLALGQAEAPPAQSAVPVVVTSGEGVVRRAPDRAWVSIAAESRARTPQEAQRANADAMNAVNARLKSLGITADAIQTVGFNLQPEYDYASGRQILRDYVARNEVQVRVDDLTKLGEAIASAVGSGATNVSGVRFDLQNRDEVEREALKRAVADARARADAAAAGAGARIDRVVKIEEQREAIVPAPRYAMMAESRAAMPAAPPSVPIESGEIEVRARVTLTAAMKNN